MSIRQHDISHFIAALSLEYRDADTILQHMNDNGRTTTIEAIRERLDKTASMIPNIEANGSSWRLVLIPTNDNDVDTPSPSNEPAPIGLHEMCGLELMRSLPNASVDLLMCDLPYGTTRNVIDPIINVEEWLQEMRRIVTSRGAIVAFCTQPFTTDLMNAGRDLWKSEIVWEKSRATGHAQSHRRMMKAHESILVFSKGTVCGGNRSKRTMTYNPQGAERVTTRNRKRNSAYHGHNFCTKAALNDPVESLHNCPRDVVYFPKDKNGLHPFAKPVALLEYLIRTYSNPGDVILDPTMGSGSTGIACIATERHFIGAENGTDHKGRCVFKLAEDRINSTNRKVS